MNLNLDVPASKFSPDVDDMLLQSPNRINYACKTNIQSHLKVNNQRALDKKTSPIMDKIQLSKWEVRLGATEYDTANIPCPMHYTRLVK